MKQLWPHYQSDDDLNTAGRSFIFIDRGYYRSGSLHNRAAVGYAEPDAVGNMDYQSDYQLPASVPG